MGKNKKKGANFITSNGARKTLFALGLSAGMFLMAGQAMAVAYAPGEAPEGVSVTGMPISGQKVLGQQGNMMWAQGAPGEFNIKAMPMGGMAYKHFGGNMHAWLGLMLVLTVMMVWVALLLLIAVLWHHLKKHKHS